MQHPATLYIVRHGETDWNTQKKIQGQTDIPLNKTGEKQAEEIAHEFDDIEFAAVFSSDLVRAHKTAEIITLEKKIAIETTELLRERNFGPLETLPRTKLIELEKDLEHFSDVERFSHKPYPEMESDEELIGRFLTFLRELAVGYEGKNVLVVTHGSLMRAVLVHTGYMTYQEAVHMRIQNTGYFKLLSDGVEMEVKDVVGIEIV